MVIAGIINNMITLMLVKFMTNDMPHAAGFISLDPKSTPTFPKPLKEIKYGRTAHGSLISKTGDKYHLEIIHPADMNIISPLLANLTRQNIPYTKESKKLYSPKHKKYINGIVINWESSTALGMPMLEH